MPRLTLQQCALSRLTDVLGICSQDLPQIANAVNAAQERLVFAKESGDEGFYGSYAEVVFNVLRDDPYVSLSRYGARLMSVDVCDKPVQVNNQFEEFLTFGNGYQSGICSRRGCGSRDVYARGVFPSFRDMTKGHLLRVRAESTLDVNGDKRTLIQGTDSNDTTITSLDGDLQVQGVYLTITSPFVDTPMTLNSLTGIQKDATNGPIQYWDVDPVTGDEKLILTMDPGEMISGYARYFFKGLPLSCCPVTQVSGQATVQVRGLVKLNLIPVVYPTDYLLIQSMEAIIAECQSMRYSTMDLPSSKAMAAQAHRDAINILNGQLTHYYGTQTPAISVKPFGSASLEKQRIGYLI